MMNTRVHTWLHSGFGLHWVTAALGRFGHVIHHVLIGWGYNNVLVYRALVVYVW